MLRNIVLVAALAFAASPAGAQSVSYGGTYYPPPMISYAGAYGGNPGPYGGTAPVPYAYGYGGGLITSNVSYGYGYGSYYGGGYGGGPYSGPFRTDSAPGGGGGY